MGVIHEFFLAPAVTVFPRINARGNYFKIRDFRGRSFEGGVYSRGAFISKFQKQWKQDMDVQK